MFTEEKYKILESCILLNEENNNEILEKVYILLIDSKSFISPIKKITKAPYSHASISFDKSMEELYSFNFKMKGMLKENLKLLTLQNLDFPFM